MSIKTNLLKKISFYHSYSYERIFSLFAISHCILWTLLPTILRFNPHLDSLEAFVWGSEWQLGYDKHPPLSAWFLELILVILGKKAWVAYFVSQICITSALVAMWHLSKLFLDKSSALMAVLLLEGIYYYNFTSTEYNTNILMLPIWAWSILYSWKACFTNQAQYWVKLGILLGLGMLSKYYTILLCTTIILMIIFEPDFRKNLKTFKPYLGVAFFLLIITPHLIWLIKNNFPTISYINTRLSSNYSIYNHLLNPFNFFLAQLLSHLGMLIIFFGAFFKFINRSAYKNFTLRTSFKDIKAVFLIFMGFGPFILTLIPSLLTASTIKDMWGTPLWNLSGIILFYFLKPSLTEISLKRFYKIWAIIMILVVLIYSLTILFNQNNKRDSFNGYLAAFEVNRLWSILNPNQPLEIVAGEIWLTSNISFFSPQKIHVFIDMDEKTSPWLSYHDIEDKGGVILWDIKEEGEELPKRFKNKISSKVIIQQPLLIKSMADRYQNQPDFKLGIAIIPSQKYFVKKTN
jgi:4-amino-4-deoxy-L-arabinose transferase-like glycosyltransferase